MPSRGVTQPPTTIRISDSNWSETRRPNSNNSSGSHRYPNDVQIITIEPKASSSSHRNSIRPSSHHSSRSHRSPEDVRVVTIKPKDSSSNHQESERPVRGPRQESYSRSSHVDSRTGEKTAFYVRDKSSGSLLRRATTAAAESRHGEVTRSAHEPSRALTSSRASSGHLGQSSHHSGALVRRDDSRDDSRSFHRSEHNTATGDSRMARLNQQIETIDLKLRVERLEREAEARREAPTIAAATYAFGLIAKRHRRDS